MPPATHINMLPGCQKPADCRAKKGFLCASCVAVSTAGSIQGARILRIELTASRRRRLGDMARDAKVPADRLASKLLSDLIDDDAAAHAGAS